MLKKQQREKAFFEENGVLDGERLGWITEADSAAVRSRDSQYSLHPHTDRPRPALPAPLGGFCPTLWPPTLALHGSCSPR